MNYVMLHGWASSRAIWKPLLSHLPDHTPYLIDLPGHGGMSDQITVAGQLSSVNQPYVLCAWSLGSLLALEYALSHQKQIAGLILFSPVACFIAGDHWPHAMPKRAFEQFEHRFFKKGAPDFAYFRRLTASGSDEPKKHAELLATLDDQLPEPSLSGLQIGLEQLKTKDMSHRLSELGIPVLLISGTQDVLVPVESVIDLSKRLNQVKYRILEGVGHLPHIVSPKQCADIISTWKPDAIV